MKKFNGKREDVSSSGGKSLRRNFIRLFQYKEEKRKRRQSFSSNTQLGDEG